MNNMNFKLPKFKVSIDPYVAEQVIVHGMLLAVYNPDTENEEDQPTGYQILKKLVTSQLPSMENLNADGEFVRFVPDVDGYALLGQVPADYRIEFLRSAQHLQNMLHERAKNKKL